MELDPSFSYSHIAAPSTMLLQQYNTKHGSKQTHTVWSMLSFYWPGEERGIEILQLKKHEGSPRTKAVFYGVHRSLARDFS